MCTFEGQQLRHPVTVEGMDPAGQRAQRNVVEVWQRKLVALRGVAHASYSFRGRRSSLLAGGLGRLVPAQQRGGRCAAKRRARGDGDLRAGHGRRRDEGQVGPDRSIDGATPEHQTGMVGWRHVQLSGLRRVQQQRVDLAPDDVPSVALGSRPRTSLVGRLLAMRSRRAAAPTRQLARRANAESVPDQGRLNPPK